ncbi:MAG: DUF6232 family protein [Cystobacter sp.]
MRDNESGQEQVTRKAAPLWLVSSTPSVAVASLGEQVLVEGAGLRLTSERLEVEGRSWRLEELRGFGTRRESPGLMVPLGLGVSAALSVPGLLLQPGSFRVTAALVVALLLVFAAIGWLVAAADTYRLLVRTAEGERQVWCGQDHQLLARVVRELGEKLERADAPRPAVVRRLALVR